VPFEVAVADLWDKFNSLEVESFHILDKMRICSEIIKATKDDIEKQNAEYEMKAVNIVFSIHHSLESLAAFDKDVVLSKIQEFVNQSDAGSFSYYSQRYNQSTNVFDKWRYAFCCWVIKKDFPSLKQATTCLLQCSEQRLQEKNYLESVFLLEKTYNIARLYNLANTAKSEFDKIIAQAVEVIIATKGTEHARWMIEPAQIIGTTRDSVKPEKASKLLTILHHEASLFHSKEDYHLQQSILEASIALSDFFAITLQERKQLKKTFRTMIGESYVDHAEWGLGHDNAMLAVTSYQHAVEQFQKAGRQDRIDILNEKIRDASEKVMAEMKPIEVKIELPTLQFASTDEYSLVKEIVEYTAHLLPSLSRIRQTTKENLEKYPLSLTVVNIKFNEKNPTSTSTDENSIVESHLMTDLNRQVQLTDHYLASAVQELEKDGKITAGGYTKFVSDAGLLEESTFELVARGIERHYAKDYISSISILIPQIEATLRTLLNSKGVGTLKTKRNIIMDNELGGLLNLPETKELLGENFVVYLKVKYTEQEGNNVRNEMSHGLLHVQKFTLEESLAAIRVILLLAKLSLKTP
jgi:hypothetical protein